VCMPSAIAMLRGCCATRRRHSLQVAEETETDLLAAAANDFQRAVLTEEFWASLEEQQPRHLPNVASQLLTSFSIDDIVSAFVRGSEAGFVAAHKRGEQYMRENIFLSYLDNASLNLTGAECFLKPLLAACQTLAPALGGHSVARLLLEPPEGRGPPLIADGDLLLLQLWGDQLLTLRRPTNRMGVSAPRPKPLLAAELRPGDALVVPGGVECHVTGGKLSVAVARASPSVDAPWPQEGPLLYALLPLRMPEQSLDVALAKYLNDVLLESSLSQEADCFFRAAVTKHSRPERYFSSKTSLGSSSDEVADLATEVKGRELAAKLSTSATELASKISAAGLRKHMAARAKQLREEQEKSARKFLTERVVGAEQVVRTTSFVCVPSQIACHCEKGAAVAQFKRGSETLNLPISPTASGLIAKLSDALPHVVGDLPCEDPVERICVCQILIFKGCLELIEAPRD